MFPMFPVKNGFPIREKYFLIYFLAQIFIYIALFFSPGTPGTSGTFVIFQRFADLTTGNKPGTFFCGCFVEKSSKSLA